MEKIIIYTQETCEYCKTIKEEFNKNKVKFIEKSTMDYADDWNEIVSLTGMPTTPTIYYKQNYFIAGRDFGNPPQLIEILNNFKNTKEINLFQIAEKIKTLNYNIASAFGRLDQILKQIENKLKENKDEYKRTS